MAKQITLIGKHYKTATKRVHFWTPAGSLHYWYLEREWSMVIGDNYQPDLTPVQARGILKAWYEAGIIKTVHKHA